MANDRGSTHELRALTPSLRRVSRGACAPALAISGGGVQHPSLLRAHIMPSWLWSAFALTNGAAPATGMSPSVPTRSATCQWRSNTSSQRTWRRCAGACCLWGEGAALELAARPRYAALFSDGTYSMRTAPARGPSPLAHDRGTTCQLRPPRRQGNASCHAAQVRRRSLSLGRRRSTRACCARKPYCAVRE